MVSPSASVGNDPRFKIAFCLPVLRSSDTDDSSFLQQMLIMNGLKARGHELTFIAPYDLCEVACTTDIEKPEFVERTWTRAIWFDLLGKLAWRIQKWLGITNLNVFSNLRWFDAYQHCLPGHDIVQNGTDSTKWA
jgi:hypothetical protein